jgi:hypothetical protein
VRFNSGAAGVAVGCQGIVTLPDTALNSASLQSLHVFIRIQDRVVTGQRARNGVYRGALPTHDLHREHPHPPRPSLTGVSLATNEFNE